MEDSFGISPPCGTVGVGSLVESGMYGECSKHIGGRAVPTAHAAEESFLFESARILPGAFPVVQLLGKHRPQSYSWALLDAILISAVGYEIQRQYANGKSLW